MYAFTNHFSGPHLRHRIGMINRQRSGWATWIRYVLWVGLVGAMAVACRHREDSNEKPIYGHAHQKLPITNASRALTTELDAHGMPWYKQSALSNKERVGFIRGRRVVLTSFTAYPDVVCLRNNRLGLRLQAGQSVRVFIDGRASTEKALFSLTFDEVDDLFVYKKWDDAAGAEAYPESHRVLVNTTHAKPADDPVRVRWKQYLQAAAVSDHPLGESSTFTMNKLLEATFFGNKLAFVQRTKDDHLVLLDEFSQGIDLYINGLPATPDAVRQVHIREVDRLYANERPFDEWLDGSNRLSRFVLYIQTAPQRAKRDSTYYVFSPFYSGDF